MPDDKYIAENISVAPLNLSEQEQSFTTSIPVIEEEVQISKKAVHTATVQISKKVSETEEEINIPLTAEQYNVTRVPINEVVATLPPAVRYEGDTMIISVIKEVLVVEKKYEIIEEVHVTKQTSQTTETQHITLRKEQVSIERTPANEGSV